jgi:DNA-binding CsgD family transcriptional regulator
LSTREGDVLQLIVSGRTNAEICLLLNLSINSVKTYIRMAYRKIGVERRSQAVVWGLKHAGPPAEGTDEAVDLTM